MLSWSSLRRSGEGEVVSAVNFNSPGQVVIAGAKAAVERAMALCKGRCQACPAAAGQRAVALRADAPAAERFAESVNAIDWQAPQIPVVQNVTAAIAADLETLKRTCWHSCTSRCAGLIVQTLAAAVR
jgi:[acyl-carrier-protein] S-malonyltransferase